MTFLNESVTEREVIKRELKRNDTYTLCMDVPCF